MIRKQPLQKSKFPPDFEKYPCRNTSLVNLTNEEWVPIPEFEDYFEISNYGRVKSLAREIQYPNGKVIHKKERIIRAGVSPAPNYYTGDYTYQLGITLNVNNEKYCFSIARLVYHCHVKAIDSQDQKLYVLQKDGNGLNCDYKNLHTFDSNGKQKRIYERKRNITCFSWLDMKAIVQKDLKRRMRPVTQYTDKGKRIKVFESIKSAGESTGIPKAHISAVANDYWPRAGGFVWRHGKGPAKMDFTEYFAAKKASYKEKRGFKIDQFTLAGKKVATFLSIMDASKQTGISNSLISRAVNGILKSTRGYIWKLKK